MVVVAMPATATGDVCVQILWLEGGGGEFGLRKGNPKIELRGCGSRGILYVCTHSLSSIPLTWAKVKIPQRGFTESNAVDRGIEKEADRQRISTEPLANVGCLPFSVPITN